MRSTNLTISKLLALGASAALILGASACGGSDKPTPTKPAAAPVAPTTPPVTCDKDHPNEGWKVPTWYGNACGFVFESSLLLKDAAKKTEFKVGDVVNVRALGPSASRTCNGVEIKGSSPFPRTAWCPEDGQGTIVVPDGTFDNAIKNGVKDGFGSVVKSYSDYVVHFNGKKASLTESAGVSGALLKYLVKKDVLTEAEATEIRDEQYGDSVNASATLTVAFNSGKYLL